MVKFTAGFALAALSMGAPLANAAEFKVRFALKPVDIED